MDPVHDIPPAARLQQDPLQVLSGTITALAAVMDRYAWQRERAAEAADRDLAAARRELREAQRQSRTAALRAHGEPTPGRESTPEAAGPRTAERAPTTGPAQEEAAVLAAHYTRVPRHSGAGDPAAAWLGRASRANAATPWRLLPDGTPEWASSGAAAERAERQRQRVAAWTAQAEQLAADPAAVAGAAVSRRRAYEALVLAAYWQDKADRLASGGPAYAPDDRYLAAAFDSIAAAASTAAATDAELATRDHRDAVADEATPDDPRTLGLDEHQVGRGRAAAEADRAGSSRTAAATADGEAAAAQRAARAIRGRAAGSGPNSVSMSAMSRPLRRTLRCTGPNH